MVAAFEASPRFIDSAAKLDPHLVSFVASIARLSDEGFVAGASESCSQAFGKAPADYADADAYSQSYTNVAASLVAAAADVAVSGQTRTLLVGAVRALWLIGRLADGETVTRASMNAAPILLPDGIFPLPEPGADAAREAPSTSDNAPSADAERRQRFESLLTDLESHRQATAELLTAFEQSGPAPASPTADRAAPSTRDSTGFLLPHAVAGQLSSGTKTVLKTIGVHGDQVDVARAVSLLERQAATIATQLYAQPGASGTLVRLGNRLIPGAALTDGPRAVALPGDNTIRIPGPCAPVPPAAAAEDGVTVPTGHGEARILGIADLNVVEQELLRYQLGEIAHIENVVKGEARSRMFRTKDTTQQTDFTSTQVTHDKEQDLASASRFELQTQSQSVINQNASKDAGLTIHASYGPSVDATANYNTSSSVSTQQSRSASTNYAKEITSKAVDRVQTQTVTSRTVTQTRVIDDVSRHSFDNTAGSDDIVGIYRYLDKIYSAQVVNYGKRLLLEFVVPEPAAFLRYALTHKPLTQVTAVNPDPPGYCVDGTFVPLQASDLTRYDYLYWASTYGVQDITSPPPSVIVASGSLKSPDQMQTVGDALLGSDVFQVAIAAGYLTQSAFVNVYGETQAGDHRVVVQLQDQQRVYEEPTDDQGTYTLHLLPTPTLDVTVNSLRFHNYEILVTVFCTLSDEAFQDWQLKTFNSIMKAYSDLRSSYAEAVAEAQLRANVNVVFGTNPETNRATEQTELKKSCISLLTGQRFDAFDAMQRDVAPFGYPEIEFAEARAEGRYIQMFEQSFEWNNMTYLFYPYFWGQKDDWPTLAQLTDDDPMFAEFLQAGAARVQVPVRLGFEDNVLTYLSTGNIWAAEGMLVTGDDDAALHLSIVDELKSQTGDNAVDGVGTLSVTHGTASITGAGTQFTPDDENRRIVIGGVTYVIKTVTDPLSIELRGPYQGDTASGVGYALAGELVGQPWEIKLPTDLIKLDNSLLIA